MVEYEAKIIEIAVVRSEEDDIESLKRQDGDDSKIDELADIVEKEAHQKEDDEIVGKEVRDVDVPIGLSEHGRLAFLIPNDKLSEE